MRSKRPACKKLLEREEGLAEIINTHENSLETRLVPATAEPMLNTAFTPSKTRLLLASGHLQGRPIRILFDTGSEISYVRKDFCTSQKTSYSKSDFSATMANKETQHLHRTNRPLNLQLNWYTENISFAVRFLTHDILLRMKWNTEDKKKMHLNTKKKMVQYCCLSMWAVFDFITKHRWSRIPK